jgi:hypothetical protein
LGSGERNDYKEESITLPAAKKDKNSANIEVFAKVRKGGFREFEKKIKYE